MSPLTYFKYVKIDNKGIYNYRVDLPVSILKSIDLWKEVVGCFGAMQIRAQNAQDLAFANSQSGHVVKEIKLDLHIDNCDAAIGTVRHMVDGSMKYYSRYGTDRAFASSKPEHHSIRLFCKKTFPRLTKDVEMYRFTNRNR